VKELLLWIELSGVGLLFGLFPSWWLCTAIFVENVEYGGKTSPKWITLLANNNPGLGLFHFLLVKKTWYQKILWIMSGLVIGVFLWGYFTFGHETYIGHGIARMVVFFMSFPIFLLLVWLVPAIILNRYYHKQDDHQ